MEFLHSIHHSTDQTFIGCKLMCQLLWSDRAATIEDSKRNTVLHYAARLRCLACISFFLDRGMATAIKAPNSFRATPLGLVMQGGSDQVRGEENYIAALL